MKKNFFSTQIQWKRNFKRQNSLRGKLNYPVIGSESSSVSSKESGFFNDLKLEYFWSNFINLSRALEALWMGDSSGSLSDSLGAELIKENFRSGNGVVLSEACLTFGWLGFLINGESKMGSESSSLSWNSLAIGEKQKNWWSG